MEQKNNKATCELQLRFTVWVRTLIVGSSQKFSKGDNFHNCIPQVYRFYHTIKI